jgi:thiol-disulfide isomerase/thioredoxin
MLFARSALAVVLTFASAACSRAAAAPASEAPHAKPPSDAQPGADLLGVIPPEWEAEHWLNSHPLRLSELRGNVVLVRWWTAGCPYCEATAPALRDFDRAYKPRGLVVVGMYHHKDEGVLDYGVVETTASKYGFTFPIAVDPEWKTLNRWWEPKAREDSARPPGWPVREGR